MYIGIRDIHNQVVFLVAKRLEIWISKAMMVTNPIRICRHIKPKFHPVSLTDFCFICFLQKIITKSQLKSVPVVLSWFYIATLGSILDSQSSWESGKFQLARWSHEVALFPVRIPPTHPPTHPPPMLGRPESCGDVPTIDWTSYQILSNVMCGQITSIGMCGVPYPPLLLKHLWILCVVPTLVWPSDQMSQMEMCGVPPPNSQTSYQFSWHFSSTCILECGTPSWAS